MVCLVCDFKAASALSSVGPLSSPPPRDTSHSFVKMIFGNEDGDISPFDRNDNSDTSPGLAAIEFNLDPPHERSFWGDQEDPQDDILDLLVDCGLGPVQQSSFPGNLEEIADDHCGVVGMTPLVEPPFVSNTGTGANDVPVRPRAVVGAFSPLDGALCPPAHQRFIGHEGSKCGGSAQSAFHAPPRPLTSDGCSKQTFTPPPVDNVDYAFMTLPPWDEEPWIPLPPSRDADDDGSTSLDSVSANLPPGRTPHFLNEADCICERGGLSNHHAGTLAYRDKVRELLTLHDYGSLSKRDKRHLWGQVVDWVHSRGGGFVKREKDTQAGSSGPWYVVEREKALEKVAQCFRDRAAE